MARNFMLMRLMCMPFNSIDDYNNNEPDAKVILDYGNVVFSLGFTTNCQRWSRVHFFGLRACVFVLPAGSLCAIFWALNFALLQSRSRPPRFSSSYFRGERKARTGKPGHGRQNRTGRAGQAERDRQNWTDRAGQAEQDR
jgi:hypothetical protein